MPDTLQMYADNQLHHLQFRTELDNARSSILVFEVNFTQQILKFWQKVTIKVNMTVRELHHESKSSWVLLNKQILMKKTDIS